MRSSHARYTKEVRSGVQGGRGPDRPGDGQADRRRWPANWVCNAGTLGSWVSHGPREREGAQGLVRPRAMRAELKRLRTENAELRMERDVLKAIGGPRVLSRVSG